MQCKMADSELQPAKKKRRFLPAWMEEFRWLKEENEKMYCEICKVTGKKNPFTTSGCNNYQKSALERHQNSKDHITSISDLKLRKSFQVTVANAKKNIENETQEITRRHIVQLRTVYVMTKNNIAADNFIPIMELQAANGCSDASVFYKKPEIISEMESVLAKCVEDNLIKELNDPRTPFIGLMLDETCDISIEKKLAIYARYVNSETGAVNTSFVGNKRITNCTASGIKDALCEFLEEKGLVQGDDYSRIVGLGTDGAAVMTGRHNGLGVKLKQLNNILIQVHCVAHRLNLAASQASKDIDYLERYREQINSIYKFYSNSSVRYDKLKEIQQLLHGKVKQVVEPSSVRWLSVEACVKVIFEYFESLVMSLENEKSSNPTAVGIWQFAASAQFLLTTALLIDVLSVIGTLSLLFQKDIANLSVIKHSVTSTVETIQGMIDGSPTVNRVLADLGDIPGTGKNSYKGVEIVDNNNLRTRFNSVRRRYLNQLINNLHDRFPEDDLELLECFDVILNPRRLPDDVRELGSHAIQQLNKLCHHFETVLDSDRCKNQFLQFKHLVRSYRAMNFEQFTSTLIQEYKHVHPDFVQLALISLVIPVSSAPCERGFSVQNSIKTKLRNRLNPERLNRMMMVRLVGPHFEDVDFLTAARAFSAMKTRQK